MALNGSVLCERIYYIYGNSIQSVIATYRISWQTLQFADATILRHFFQNEIDRLLVFGFCFHKLKLAYNIYSISKNSDLRDDFMNMHVNLDGQNQVSQVAPFRLLQSSWPSLWRLQAWNRRRWATWPEDIGSAQHDTIRLWFRPARLGGLRQAGAGIRRLLSGVGHRISSRTVQSPTSETLLLSWRWLNTNCRTEVEELLHGTRFLR